MICFQKLLFSLDFLETVEISLSNNVQWVSLFTFLDDIIAFFHLDFFHSIDNDHFISFVEVLEQNGTSDEAQNQNFNLLAFWNGSNFMFFFWVEVSKDFFRDSPPAHFLSHLFFLQHFVLVKGFFLHFVVWIWIVGWTLSFCCHKAYAYLDVPEAIKRQTLLGLLAFSWRFHRPEAGWRCSHVWQDNLVFLCVFLTSVIILLIYFP